MSGSPSHPTTLSASPIQLHVGQLTRLPFHSGYATGDAPMGQQAFDDDFSESRYNYTLADEVPACEVEQSHAVPSALNSQPTSHSALCETGYSNETDIAKVWLASSRENKF